MLQIGLYHRLFLYLSHKLNLLLVLLALLFVPVAAMAVEQSQNQLQDPAEISQLVESLLLARADNYDARPDISIADFDLHNYQQCLDLDARISGSGDLRPITTVVVSCSNPASWRLYVKANIKLIGQYYVASRVIQKDETITAADLETREADLLRKRNAITNADNIIGWLSSRRIASGATIRFSALRDPNSIARGQQVSTVAHGIGFVINGVAQAISAGPPGAQIQVRTPGGKVITGTVVDANTVQIPM